MDESQQRSRLLARILARYEIVTRDLRFGDQVTISFTQVRDPDTVLDDVVAEADRREKIKGEPEHEDDLHLPYWAELWDSAFGVAEWLVEIQRGTPTLSVLDLGCGMGLAGTVAAAIGHRVMLADLEAEALLFARYNAMQFPSVRVRRLDWRRDRLNEKFDLILGADVLYEKAQWEFLDAFWKHHLRDDSTTACVILGEPGRQTGEMFVDWIASKNWKLERAEQKVATRDKPIRLFKLFR